MKVEKSHLLSYFAKASDVSSQRCQGLWSQLWVNERGLKLMRELQISSTSHGRNYAPSSNPIKQSRIRSWSWLTSKLYFRATCYWRSICLVPLLRRFYSTNPFLGWGFSVSFTCNVLLPGIPVSPNAIWLHLTEWGRQSAIMITRFAFAGLKIQSTKKIHVTPNSQFELPTTQLSIPAVSVIYSAFVRDRNCRR